MNAAFRVLVARGVTGIDRADRASLRRLARQALTGLPRRGPVHLVVVDDAAMRELNARYRGLDRTTDVLSFDLAGAEDDAGEAPSGEVYVSLDQARKQAAEQGVPLLEELGRLLVHGLLHLAGRDHKTTAQRRGMEADTERLLAAAGLTGATPPRGRGTALVGSVPRKE